MSDDDVYLAIVDDVWKEIEARKPITRDGVREIIDELSYMYTSKIESAFQEIEDNYCEEKGLEWLDE
jgi:hypothetical protein